MKIYCARPMKGHSYDEIAGYYEEMGSILGNMGYEVFNPMCGKGYLKGETDFKGTGYSQPLSCDRAIILRDKWMAESCDVLFCNLIGAKIISIGAMFEIAWAYAKGKHVVLVMKENNIHSHAFVTECSHVVYHSLSDALEYLAQLSKMEI